jgi:hypothetical protein
MSDIHNGSSYCVMRGWQLGGPWGAGGHKAASGAAAGGT